MEVALDFSKMEFFDFNSIERTNSTTEYVAMSDDCYMCQDCYNR
mgnify:FL=1